MIILGGGGHTQEMVEILSTGPSFSHINIVLSSCDTMSSDVLFQSISPKSYSLHRVDRPNSVNKPYSILQIVWSIIMAFSVVIKSRSDFLLCNGPGLCVPVALAYKILNPWKPVFYVESMTRVKSLSLSGRILQYITSAFIVQSKLLESRKYPKRTYQSIFEIKIRLE